MQVTQQTRPTRRPTASCSHWKMPSFATVSSRSKVTVADCGSVFGVERIHFVAFSATEWKLLQPIILDVERLSNGQVIVSDDVFRLFGAGAGLERALHDYETTLVDFYISVEAGVLAGRPGRERALTRLSAYMTRVDSSQSGA